MSSLAIRLGPQPAPAEGVGIKIPLGLAVGAGAPALQQRDQQILRAVGAAVALRDPRVALELAQKVRAENADLATFFGTIDSAKLNPVLEEVARVQKDRSGAGTPSEEERLLAAAVGADPVLVAAASARLKGDDDAVRAAGLWVGIADSNLLGTAAAVGARRSALSRILSTSTSASIAQLENKVDKGFKEVNERIDKVNTKIDNSVRDISAKIDDIKAKR